MSVRGSREIASVCCERASVEPRERDVATAIKEDDGEDDVRRERARPLTGDGVPGTHARELPLSESRAPPLGLMLSLIADVDVAWACCDEEEEVSRERAVNTGDASGSSFGVEQGGGVAVAFEEEDADTCSDEATPLLWV